jgi:radical SAM-linked protein
MRGDRGFPVRIRFSKHGKVRFISHRDVARAFERAFRIEQLPLAFTEGFSPRPKVSFGLALSVGHESEAEYLDVELTEPVDTDGLPERLTPALPEGMPATGAVRLIERAPALQESITEVQYRVATVDSHGHPVPEAVLCAAASGAMGSTSLPVTRIRKGKESVDDLRPALRSIEVARDDDTPVLDLTLLTQPRGARPREVLDALDQFTSETGVGVGLAEHRVTRTSQWIERGGARLEPLAADAFAPVLEASAS